MNLRRPVLGLLLAIALCMAGVPGAGATPSTTHRDAAAVVETPGAVNPAPLADRSLIVRFKGDLTADRLSSVYRAADTSAGAVEVIGAEVLKWHVPAGQSVAGFADSLEYTGQVEYAEPNYLRQLAGYTPPAYVEPNDPAYADERTMTLSTNTGTLLESYDAAKSWWLRDIHAVAPTGSNAWRIGYTGADISGKYPLRVDGSEFKVAVIDTGVYLDHPDRSLNMIPGSVDYVPVDPSVVVDAFHEVDRVAKVSHGSCVAGQIAAAAGNGVGSLGLANDTVVAAYKVYWGNGISDDDLIPAIYKAANDGCRVINLSIAGGPATAALQDAIDYAWGKGCVIVAATGNEGIGTVSNPAAMTHVVAVGALAHNASGIRKRASYSNYGSALDISAPGSSIWGMTKPGYVDPDEGEPGYRWWDGTSMASPVVAGGIAWLWRAAPWMTNAEIVSLVENTAADMGTAGRDNTYGHGALDMEAAYRKLIATYPHLKTPTITPLSEDNARNIRVEWAPVSGYDVRYDVSVDGNGLLSNTSATSVTLPYDTSVGAHVIKVTAKSPRNWADDAASDSYTVYPSAAIPEVTSLRYYRGKLLWTDTESGRTHADLLSIDGGPSRAVSDGSTSTASLAHGSHTASLTVRDSGGTISEAKTLAFTVRPAPTVSRVTGSDRYRHATALSRSTFAAASNAVLVGGGSWADAFSAAPLARMVRGPVLPTYRTALPATTKAELARLGVKRIIIVGNTKDVSAALSRSLVKRGYSVSRISGSDRYATANAVARSIYQRAGDELPDGKVVVVGDSYSNALAASAVAARRGWPLLYSGSKSVPRSTQDTLRAIHTTSTLIVGSTASVSTAAASKLPGSNKRIIGSTALADWATATYPEDFSGERIYLANSSAWATALGVPAAAAHKGGLVLVTPAQLASSVKGYYAARSEIAVTTKVLGSSHFVWSSSVATIKGIVGAP
jgi:hypothetical protein